MCTGLENGYAHKPNGLIYYMRNVFEHNVSASTLCLGFLFSLFKVRQGGVSVCISIDVCCNGKFGRHLALRLKLKI